MQTSNTPVLADTEVLSYNTSTNYFILMLENEYDENEPRYIR